MRIPFLKRVLRSAIESEVAELKKQIATLRTRGSAAESHEPLIAVARALRDATQMEEFADSAVAAAIALTGAERGALVLSGENDLVLAAARDKRTKLECAKFPLSGTIASVAARSGEVVATGRAAEDERFRSHASVAKFGTESVLALPLKRAEKPIGCLYLEAPAEGFASFLPETLIATVDLISVAIVRLEGEAEREQRAKLQAVGLAAAAIAHDLRSPLTSTAFALSTLKPNTDEDEKLLARARGSCFRARELSEGLVSLATGRRLTVSPKNEKLAQLVNDYLRLFEDELADSGIKIVRELDTGVRAHVDRPAIQRVLDNLIRNAQRAMGSGGKLTVGCGPKGTGKAGLWVGDSGPGMSGEQIDRLFHLSEETLAGGLGLVVVRRLVEAMDGLIETESSPGKGTTFCVLLPRATGTTSGIHAAARTV